MIKFVNFSCFAYCYHFYYLIGTEFIDYNGQLPNIEAEINLEVGVSFPTLEIADHYIIQYAKQQHFAIFKAKLETYNDKTFRKRVFKCDLGGHYEQKLFNPTICITIYHIK